MNSNFVLLLLLAMSNNGNNEPNSCDPLSLILCCLSFANCLGCRAAEIGRNICPEPPTTDRRISESQRRRDHGGVALYVIDRLCRIASPSASGLADAPRHSDDKRDGDGLHSKCKNG